MPKQRNNKHKKSILELITAVVLSSLLTLLPLFSLVSQKNDVYADGFSNADIILLEAIKNGLKKCIDNGFLKKTEIPNSNDLKAEKLYNNTGDVRKENFVALPYRYGTGNTLSDGGVSCKELFEGFSGGASNSFNTYLQLGGSGAPTITNGTDPTERKNAFLEALGYSSDESGNKQATCGKLVYSVVKGTISTTNFTNTICVSTDAEGNIVSSRGAGKNLNEDDFTDKGGASNQNLTLKYEDGAITLKVDTSKDVGNCTLGPAKVYSSQKIKNGNSRTNAKDLFNNFFDSIPANSLSDAHSEVIGSSNDFDVNGAPAVHGGCVPKTLKKELKADSVLVRTSESKSSVSAENTSTNSDSSDESGNKQATCGKLVYSVVKGTISTTNFTNTICVSTDAEGNIVSSRGAGKNLNEDDFTDKGGASNQNLTLKYEDGAITLKVDTSKDVGNCTLGPAKVYSSQKIKNGNSRTNAKDLFNNFFDSIPANSLSDAHSEVIGSSNDFDVNGAPAVHGGCVPKTLKKELKADSVLVRTSESKSSVSAENTSTNSDLNAAMGKHYKYTGSPDYDKLMKILVPNYSAPDDNTTALASAYNWFYLLNDVFNGISVDNSIKCNKTQPSNGIYLKYYNRSDDDPEKFEEEYCALDEAALNQKNTTVIMSDGEAGKVNGALRSSSGVMIGLLTARDVLDNLNRLDLPSLCAQDGSFPLCRANPSECQEDPTKEDCRNANNASETGEDGQNGEQAVCMQNAGALGWIICPLMYGIRDAANGLFEKAVTPLLRVHESVLTGLNSNSNSPMYQAWSFFRNVANIMFVIAMLFVIFSQITGFGIDNYGIKKILPKLIVTAIIVNFSYIICGIFVDLSNIFGEGIKNIFESVAGSTTATTEKLGENVAALINEVVGMIATVAAAGGAAALGLTAVNAVTSGSLLTIIFPILAFIGSALMAAFFAMLMLGLRQALIIIMIVVSPVAFVLYAIPNTNGLFKKWFQLFKTLLMLFPVFCFMVGGGFLVSNIIIKADSDIFMKIIGGLISIAPYFAVPSMTKNAMKGFDGAVAGLGTLQQKANNAGTSINKKITNSDAMKDSMQNAQIGKMQRYVDKYSDKDVSKLASWKKRRLSNAVGFLNKDGRKNAAVGAAMREYAYNNSQENVDRINAAEINALNDTVKSDLMSSYKSENLSNLDALKQLKDAQGYDYSTGTTEANRDNDNRIRALSSYLASTKEGQKTLDQYMSGGYVKKDASGNVIESVSMGNSSKRAMAVMGRNMVDNHANLRDKYQVAFDQFDNMRGNQKIEDMTSAADGKTLDSGFDASLSNVVKRMDLDDENKLGKQDFEKLYKEAKIGPTSLTFKPGSDQYKKLQGLADARIKQLKSDTTLISGLSDEEKKFLSLYSTGNVDASTISNVLYMKDASGTVTGTIEQS